MTPAEREMQHPSPPEPSAQLTSGVKTGRALWAIALVAGFAELAYAVMNVSAMPVYLKLSMHYGEAMIAIIGTAFLLCEGVMKGPFGILGDHIGRKWLIIVGPMLSVITALATLFVPAHAWYLFVLLRVIDGLGAAALWPAALAMIADVVPEERRSQAMSLFNVTYLIGIGMGPIIGGAANDLTRQFIPNADPRQASFYLISVIFLITAVTALFVIPNVKLKHGHHESEEAGFSFAALWESLRMIPETLLMAFVTFFGVGQIMLIIKLFALAEFGVSETGFGAMLLVPCVVIALASVPLGTVGDRFGKTRAVKIGLGLCALSMWSMIFIKSHFSLILGGSIIGLGFVLAFPSWMAHVSQSCDPRRRGAVMGAVGTAQGLGAMFGAPLGGWLYEHAHLKISFLPQVNSHYTPFIGCAGMLLLAWILSLTTLKEASAPCS
jgi:DHA1 family multidrug resistance protein-like MFS transporter